MPDITITLTDADLAQLTTTTMQLRWSDGAWDSDWPLQVEQGRFELVNPAGINEKISLNWRYVYWVGSDWTAVVLFRAYLDHHDETYQILWDTTTNGPGYVIVTNYATFVHQ